MHYSKQAGALAFHDTCRQTHIVLAEDISSHGHKRYHVVRRADIENYHGPYNELIRTDSNCRLYFDLDSSMPTDSTVQELIEEVCTEISNRFPSRPSTDNRSMLKQRDEVFEARYFSPDRFQRQLDAYAPICKGTYHSPARGLFRLQSESLFSNAELPQIRAGCAHVPIDDI